MASSPPFQTAQLRVAPALARDNDALRRALCRHLGWKEEELGQWRIRRRSLDARGNRPVYVLQLEYSRGRTSLGPTWDPGLRDCHQGEPVIIIGTGPAGLFCALRLVQLGYRPLLLERGKDIRSRRRDLAMLNRQGILNPHSNYCFGEGGAGTYSDGKLYTRSGKRGDLNTVLRFFHYFGAEEQILVDAHPHIGTNKLPGIIESIRQKLLDCGAQFEFETPMVDFFLHRDRLKGVISADGRYWESRSVFLATGHSARDIYRLLWHRGLRLEAKPFALGVRIEHNQEWINRLQYGAAAGDPDLPPAAYSLVDSRFAKSVFSFCMCPGGIIAPAATSPGELVVNGWSPSKRNNPFANSGWVATVGPQDFARGGWNGPLAGMYYQQSVEKAAYEAGGGDQVAPAQSLEDFLRGRVSNTLWPCSYVPGIRSAPVHEILPPPVYQALKAVFSRPRGQLKGLVQAPALVVATESRTSAPLRIPRDPQRWDHPQLPGLYPIGEGAGYAGGIVSAALDGIRAAEAMARNRERD